jgi:phosphatidate cytidylyltransferase
VTGSADQTLLWVFGGVLGLLGVATLAGAVLARTRRSESSRATIENLNARIRAWWLMSALVGLALWIGLWGAVVLFGLLSFLALREFLTLTPTRRGDHATLVYSFFVVAPVQYALVAMDWYGLFSIFIPVYAFLFVPTRIALAGDPKRFLERTAVIQWGQMICVYCVSHAPALLLLEIPGYEGRSILLILYMVFVVQLSDVLQYVWGKTLGRHKIAPTVSPNKTVEGFVGGVLSATAIGTALWWMTPFTPLQAAGMSLAMTLCGFFGGLTMSAIKRDRGVKDFGSLIEGHGGVLDRIDSICFAAPIFFHLTRYFFVR